MNNGFIIYITQIYFNIKKNYTNYQTYISNKYTIKNIYINKYIFQITIIF